LWTSKSLRHLAAALGERGHRVSHETVAVLLRELGYDSTRIVTLRTSKVI
jgi:methylmalonyl-CoA mutase cobalamin-binding subunit